ncbi:response regulator [Natronosalvus halobius]|uniref:response regulator n=1 Tax=Natronosalvus halobius TaxID=2953746 RepID=UPI00209E91A4|nr:response regulator [Natronosalvus halobius]USZ70833.1 response regulator [Natronosalvus halobius]
MNATRNEHTDVLLIEDNPGDIRLIEEAFETHSEGVTLSVVHDGIAALDFLFQRGDYGDSPTPGLVLLDLNLPRKNGDEILEEMKNEPTLRRIPVVVLTSSQAREDVLRTYDKCANAFLTKPIDPDEFLEIIESVREFWLSTARLPDSRG